MSFKKSTHYRVPIVNERINIYFTFYFWLLLLRRFLVQNNLVYLFLSGNCIISYLIRTIRKKRELGKWVSRAHFQDEIKITL